MHYIKDRLEDIIAGLVTVGIGLFIFVEAGGYRMGTLYSMGPGYFPRLLGIGMMVLAVVMIVTARPSKVTLSFRFEQFRGILFLGAALGAFALTVERFGLLVSVFLAVLLAAMANQRTTMVGALTLAIGTAIVSTLIFRVGLGLQIRAF
ncbi:MAG: tripartite tricarboxylate transporter TctB family protein [Pararhodobacter sp.]|nr:tripartite tricarboxylate transporter TctB family protein [Pararhodobacter sp.]